MASPPNSPSASGEPRAPRRAKPLRKVIVIVAGLTVLLLAAGWWSQRPLARIPLPDGSELLLVEAYYASHYHSHSTGIRERLRHLLPDRWGTPLADSNDEALDDANAPHHLFLVFESRAAGQQASKSTTIPWIDVEVMDSRVFVGYGHADGALEARGLRYFAVLTCYPRRALDLHLRIVAGRNKGDPQFADATISNPSPVTDAPRWIPEPVPQSRKRGAREVVLESLRLTPSPANVHDPRVPVWLSCDARIKVHEPGAPDDAFETEFELSDATGNQGADRLPLSEPAWKVHTTVRTNGTYPFSPANILSFGHVTMPGPGEYRILPQLPDSTGTARQAILAGPGRYHVHMGEELSVEAIQPPSAGVSPPSGPKDLTVECKNAELLVPGWGKSFPPPDDLIQMWRAVVGTTLVPLTSSNFEDNSGGGWSECYPILYHGDEVPPGMNVEIQSILSPIETVDFYVRPPQPETLPAASPTADEK